MIFGTMLLTACPDNNPIEEITNDYIRLKSGSTTIQIGANETLVSVDVQSNCSWSASITENSNWTDLEITSGRDGSGNQNILLATSANTTTSARSAKLTFSKGSGGIVSFTISQAAGTASLTILPDNKHEFGAEGGEYRFTINSSSDWKVTSHPTWCEIVGSPEGKSGQSSLTIKAGENPYTTPQNGQIIIEGEVPATIQVTQQGKDYSLTVNPLSLSIGATGEKQTFHLTCNGSWHIVIKESSWCRVDKATGSSNFPSGEDIAITCDPNTAESTRPNEITIVAGPEATRQTISITQTQATRPVVTPPTNLKQTSTSVSIYSSFESMFDVTEYGFSYYAEPAGTSSEKTYKVGSNGGKSGTIQGELAIEGGKKYHIRAYAISVVGTAYSDYMLVETAGRRPSSDDNDSPNL